MIIGTIKQEKAMANTPTYRRTVNPCSSQQEVKLPCMKADRQPFDWNMSR